MPSIPGYNNILTLIRLCSRYFFPASFWRSALRAGFGFHGDADAGNISMNLVDSARGFRWSLDFMRRYDEPR